MNGTHIIAELYECRTETAALTRVDDLQSLCLDACHMHGLEVVGHCFHQFGTSEAPAGATGVVVLAESHLAIHTWPELGSVTLDLYVCNYSRNNNARAEAAFTALVEAFAPARIQRQTLTRGLDGETG